MLARSRSDFIAKRAALTAPTGFLPRLLLCSGLPRASLLTMIDRLGRLGDKAGDKTKVFNQLLVPSAASEWDIGRLGHRREVLRKLMGRLSAYSRMYKLSKLGGEEIVSLTFLEWLSESCKIAERPKKSKSKKMKPSNLERVESILDDFSGGVLEVSMRPDVVLDGDASDMTVFRMFGGTEEICRPKSLGDINDINRFFEIAFERNETIYLETWLTKNYSQPVLSGKKKRKREEETTAKTSEGELAFMLLKAFVDIEQTSKGHESCILKWVPKLSISSGSPKFWKLLFSTGQEPSTTWRSLVARCCQTWSHPHISQCRSWILSHGKEEDLELDAIVRFLVQSSSLGVVSVESFVTIPLDQIDRAWGRSEDMVVSATKFALDCLVAAKSSNIKDRLCSRHGPPDCIVLLLLIAGLGRKQLQCVSQAVVERISKADEETRVILLAVILRLYAFFPQSMNLGVAILRSVLKEAVEAYSSDWLSWRSPLDDEFQDMLDSVVTNGAPVKLVLALAEGSKKHPLLMLRKLGKMGQVLERDGAVCERSSADEKRGIVYGQSLNDLLPAKVQGKLIKLTVKHWGFNFTESIWVAFLDIISTGEWL